MPERIIILGASARAAAFSALRAGFAPWTADLFADADLAARCPARRVESYPADLERVAREAPPGPWMYTGALENHPGLVDRVASQRLLWGNSGNVLRQVRDPWAVREALLAEGLPSPELAAGPADLGPGDWLRKPRRSAGGAQLQRIAAGMSARLHTSPTEPHADVYYQQLILGASASAVFVAAHGRAVLLGVTRQLIGEPWTGAREFQYSGSIGPVVLSTKDRDAWRGIGDCLARRFALQGLFGVDAIVHGEGVFPVEVNPRYPASIEVLEDSLGFSAIAFHAAACQEGQLPSGPPHRSTTICGKAIVYAPLSGPGSAALWRFIGDASDAGLWPLAADLPNAGEIFHAGRPVLTLLSRADNERDVLADLQRRAGLVLSFLETSSAQQD
jgi:predicted ATP-grasp superfamily ATP-dependent carboligase